LNANLLDIAHTQSKHIADLDALTGRLQVDLLDLAGRFARKAVRYERRQVETLMRPLEKGQCQRFHGSNSRKW
jgi:hypothetical protein